MPHPAQDIRKAFDAAAMADYDGLRRQLVPGFDDLYGAVLAVPGWPADAAPRILDIGAGTGLLSGLAQAFWPAAQITLIDLSPEMLARARERFAAMGRAVDIVTGDIAGPLPDGPFDAVVSALAIHHLGDTDKQALYRRIFGLLKPGGWFLNAEQLLGPTDAVHRLYQAEWLRRVRGAGVAEEELTAARERMRFDQEATLSDQLQWLTDIGFIDVDCFYKNFRMGTFGGRRPEV
ncbi:MAG TPA: class I SAM-dependent methyltransferase [Alphaproteobacteria bacterium]|jgi:tRNA (cmo5U34)-methyltransferase|nr:class I SAM-dependent methyltransferase [Alphaproteobacteria bacterium]HBF98586.1 class I SAM-dependent methyltransferase [Alphaproteobacteria bacterium]HCO90656.1 class I SAM-dependent methyltransferase [Alphaproteobacteria bacterium]